VTRLQAYSNGVILSQNSLVTRLQAYSNGVILSQYSLVTRLQTERTGIPLSVVANIYLIATASGPPLESTQLPPNGYVGALLPGIKRPEREPYRSKTAWS
jgi:hypothetical protein